MKIKSPYSKRILVIKTWLGLWMAMKKFTAVGLARRAVCSTISAIRWRNGGRIGRRSAQYLRALYPDAPVSLKGGTVARLDDVLPINARTYELYRFLLTVSGRADTCITPGELYPLEMSRVRLGKTIPDALKSGQTPVPRRQPDPEGITDVLPPADGGELDEGAGI